jgi:hypothetical protein
MDGSSIDGFLARRMLKTLMGVVTHGADRQVLCGFVRGPEIAIALAADGGGRITRYGRSSPPAPTTWSDETHTTTAACRPCD